MSGLDCIGPGYFGKTIGSMIRKIVAINVDIRIMILSCIYLGQNGYTVVISNLQFETKNGKK